MAWDFKQWNGIKKKILNAVFDVTSGHDHDGVNSKLVSIGTPDALSVTNASVATNAAIAYSKMAQLTTNYILAGVSNVPTVCSVAGDVTMTASGTTATFAIASGAIVNADINAAAAIAWSKLASSGDINTSGQVVDLTISGEAQGDILYRNASNWVSLPAGSAGYALITAGAGSNPYWGTPSVGASSALANSVTLEAGANDYTLIVGSAAGAYTLTIPAVSGSRTFAFINEAQSFSANQTFGQTNLHLQGGDSNALNIKVNETLTGAKTLNVKINDTDRTIDLSGNLTMGGNVTLAGALTLAGAWTHTGAHTVGLTTTSNTTLTLPITGTLSTLAGTETLTNKTLTTPVLASFYSDAGGTHTVTVQDATQTLVGRDTTDTLTNKTLSGNVATGFLYSGGGNAITFQDTVHTVIGRDTTDTLTNKTYNANGTGNVLSNVNADNAEGVTWPVANGTFAVGIPFVIVCKVSNKNGWTDKVPGVKGRILKAWSINQSVDGGQWKLGSGASGAGGDICQLQTVAANDTDVDYITGIDDSLVSFGSSDTISVYSDATLDAEIYIMCMVEA